MTTTAFNVSGKKSEFATILRLNTLFRDLDPSIIDHLANLCSMRQLDAGGTLFQKGDPGDALYGIRYGQVRIESISEDGRRVTLNALGSGDVFGEIALLDGEHRTADAVASEPTELFMLKREHLLDYIRREPQVAISVIELVCKRLRYISAQMEESLTLTIGARIARRLMALGDDFGNEVQITQDQLATYVGASRESVNRLLRGWQREGFIELKRGRVILLNYDALGVEAGLQPER